MRCFVLIYLFCFVDLGIGWVFGFTWIYLDYPRWTGLGLALGSLFFLSVSPFVWFSYIPLCYDITLFT